MPFGDCVYVSDTVFKLPSENVISPVGYNEFGVQKLFVQVSIDWSVAAKLLYVKSVPPLASLPKLPLASKSK